MKKMYVLTLAIIVALMSTITGCSKSEESGNTWLVDSKAPTVSTVGNEGDMYLDTSTYDLYQMTNQDWIKIGNISGKDGKDATTPEISIDRNGYWVINGNTTSIKATGVAGKDGVDGKDGADGVDGKRWS